jgi:hypothetical protein
MIMMNDYKVFAMLVQGNYSRHFTTMEQAVDHFYWVLYNLYPITASIHYSKREI